MPHLADEPPKLLVDQGVEGVEGVDELFLGGALGGQKIKVVEQQHVAGAEAFAKHRGHLAITSEITRLEHRGFR